MDICTHYACISTQTTYLHCSVCRHYILVFIFDLFAQLAAFISSTVLLVVLLVVGPLFERLPRVSDRLVLCDLYLVYLFIKVFLLMYTCMFVYIFRPFLPPSLWWLFRCCSDRPQTSRSTITCQYQTW